jgi:flagellin
MAISIQNTFITSKINHEMSLSNQSIQLSAKKLSSGLRVVEAGDNVSDLGISVKMKSQVQGINQALQNTGNGISFAQTGESALAEMHQILQHMRSLIVQGLSEVLSSSDKTSISKEIQENIKQIDSLVETTKFNQKKLFDGSFKNQQFQVGIDVEDSLFVSLRSLTSKQLARQVLQVSTTGVDTANSLLKDSSEYFRLNGQEIRNTTNDDDQVSYSENFASAIAKAKAINDAYEATGVRAIVLSTRTDNQADLNLAFGADVLGNSGSVLATQLTGSTYMSVNGYKITDISVEDNDATGALVDAINQGYDQTGVVAQINENGQLVLSADDGRNITISYNDSNFGYDIETSIGLRSNLGFAYGGRLILQSEKTVDLDISYGVNLALGNITQNLSYDPGSEIRWMTQTARSIKSINLETEDGRASAIDTVDLAIKHVSEQRSFLGALQNRLTGSLGQLEQYRYAVSSALSNHQDLDFAQEITNYTSAQIKFNTASQISAIAQGQQSQLLSLIPNLSISQNTSSQNAISQNISAQNIVSSSNTFNQSARQTAPSIASLRNSPFK